MVQGTVDQLMDPYLVLNVGRDHILQDTLTEILKHNPRDFKRPLKVSITQQLVRGDISVSIL